MSQDRLAPLSGESNILCLNLTCPLNQNMQDLSSVFMQNESLNMNQTVLAPADAAVQRQVFLDRFRQSMAGGMRGAAPILPQGFQRLPEATYAGGRDYVAPQGPEYQPSFLNRLRDMLGY